MESSAFNMAGFMPKWSGNPSGTGSFVAVYNFKVADYELFETTVEAAAGTETKEKLQADFMKSLNEWWSYVYIPRNIG